MDTDTAALADWALRFVDGAAQPVLVEELYAGWQLYSNRMASRSWREQVNNRWPEQGLAWKMFGEPLTELVTAGRLVTCSNADDTTAPHYALVSGHEYLSMGGTQLKDAFSWGEAPLVRRYFATPELEVIWQRKTQQRIQSRQEVHARRQRQHQQVHRAIAAGATTIPAIAASTGHHRSDIVAAIHALVEQEQICYLGRTRWGRHRWTAASPTTPANKQEEPH
jgi:hypothetical protein